MFNCKYFNLEVVRAQKMEFLNLKQGRMTIAVAVRKFERLERLCHFLQLNEDCLFLLRKKEHLAGNCPNKKNNEDIRK